MNVSTIVMRQPAQIGTLRGGWGEGTLRGGDGVRVHAGGWGKGTLRGGGGLLGVRVHCGVMG